MWNISLVIISACILTVVFSDSENYNNGEQGPVRPHASEKQHKLDHYFNNNDKDEYAHNQNDRQSPLSHRHDKPAPPLNERSPNDCNPLHYNRPPSSRDVDYKRRSNYERYSKFRYSREYSTLSHDNVYPSQRRNNRAPQFDGSASDDYDEILPPPHPRGRTSSPHYRGHHPSPHEREQSSPPHHRGPPPFPYRRGPPHPPHHRGPPPDHTGPPFHRHHGNPQHRPPPPRFPADDDGPPRLPTNQNTDHEWHEDRPTFDQPPPIENQSGTEKMPYSNHNKPSKFNDKESQSTESIPDDKSNFITSTTEEEFILDVRFGNEETDKQHSM